MANSYAKVGLGTGGNTGADWANAYQTLAAIVAGAGDTVYSSSSTNYTTNNTSQTFTPTGTLASPTKLISVNEAGSVPPVAADLLAGANISPTGTANVTFTIGAGLCLYVYGHTFRPGSSTSTASVIIQGNANGKFYGERCTFGSAGSGGGRIYLGQGGNSASCVVEWVDCDIKLGGSGQSIEMNTAFFRWRNPTLGSAAIVTTSGGVAPSTLLTASATARATDVLLEGLDLTNLGSGTILGAVTAGTRVELRDCILSDSTTRMATQTSPGIEVIVTRSAPSGTGTNWTLERHNRMGSQRSIATLYRHTATGQPDGTKTSWRITTTADASRYAPYELIPFRKWNDTTGNRTGTIYGIANLSAMPTSIELWAEFEYLSSASSTQGARVTSGVANPLTTTGTTLTADTSDWDDGVTARSNGASYSLGDMIKVASNPGRVFFCTTAGTAGSSEPAGYASAVDGGSVNESTGGTGGTAVFRAGWRFSITSPTMSTGQAGAVNAYVKCAKASVSAAIFIDPELNLA